MLEQSLRVLLAEDNPTDVIMLKAMFEEAQAAQVHWTHVTRLAEANKFLDEQQFDVVLLDLGLPDSQGLGTLVQVLERVTTVPVIVLTNLDDESLALQAVQQGAQDYFVKGSIEGSPLLRAIHYAIERKRVEDKLRQTNAKLKAVLGALPDLYFELNAKGEVTDFRAHNPQDLYIPPERFLDKPLKDYLPADLVEEVTEGIARALKTRAVVTVECALPTSFGERVYEARFSPRSDQEMVVAIVRDITERKQLEEETRHALIEKEALLKEIHHRVKNNMQVISSLLSLQASYITNQHALRMFEESQQRVQAMSLIHEKLYQTQDLSRIDFAEYINDLATNIFGAYRVNTDALTFKVNAEQIFMDIHSAIPCGLIVNELVTNSIKHAFPNSKQGEVYIDFCKEGNGKQTNYILTVRDNGIGLPENLDIDKAESFGLRLVNILVGQLDGNLEVRNDGGVAFKISF
jgi:two-component sensor histidine kinase/FixJ family two-component response regulator